MNTETLNKARQIEASISHLERKQRELNDLVCQAKCKNEIVDIWANPHGSNRVQLIEIDEVAMIKLSLKGIAKAIDANRKEFAKL